MISAANVLGHWRRSVCLRLTRALLSECVRSRSTGAAETRAAAGASQVDVRCARAGVERLKGKRRRAGNTGGNGERNLATNFAAHSGEAGARERKTGGEQLTGAQGERGGR